MKICIVNDDFKYHYYNNYIGNKINFNTILKYYKINLDGKDVIIEDYWYDYEDDILYIKLNEETKEMSENEIYDNSKSIF